MTKLSRLAGAAMFAGVALCGSAAAAPAIPQPKILMIDRAAILQTSKVGQDILRQVHDLTQKAESDLKGQGDALEAEGKQLQQQLAILAPDVKARKIKSFQAQEAGLQEKVQQRQALIQGGVIQARKQVEAALGPILQGIMQERGANLLLDRQAVVLGPTTIDVTNVAIERLNQKLPTVKVVPQAPPAGAAAAPEGQ